VRTKKFWSSNIRSKTELDRASRSTGTLQENMKHFFQETFALHFSCASKPRSAKDQKNCNISKLHPLHGDKLGKYLLSNEVHSSAISALAGIA